MRRRISHLRRETVARTLSAAITEHAGGCVDATDRALMLAWASRILAADDRYGGRAELVAQGDAVQWRSIAGLLGMASYGMLMHSQLAHSGGAGADCVLCEQSNWMWHNALVEPIATARNSTAGELHDWARNLVGRDLTGYRRRLDSAS